MKFEQHFSCMISGIYVCLLNISDLIIYRKNKKRKLLKQRIANIKGFTVFEHNATNLKLVGHHVPESLVVDDADKYVGLELAAIDAGIQPLRPMVVIARWNDTRLIKYISCYVANKFYGIVYIHTCIFKDRWASPQ